ncbi:hypothetical protein [Vibrio parahaemolyticus]|uniref:hypothetical protein n=1 Tax=Vibrio parahaemolyticus TaxID=670 RepID=UPI001122206A|nr:hypothetical protein [Vibrio parahaemolyticus]TOG64600.1 hypothetical protein CGI96_20265 [Vibrio parahaemolyticus]
MADIKASITYFDLKEFGFYRLRKKKTPEFIEGTIGDVVTSLEGWLDGKTFRNTIPWDADTNQRRVKMYCRSYKTNTITGDTILVLWKAVGDSNGNVHGAYANSNVGSNTTDDLSTGNEVAGEEVIWGQPCYYWLIPEKNKIASIKFANSVADTDSLCHYIKAFVDYRGNFANKEVSERTINHHTSGRAINIKRVTFTAQDENGNTFHTSFKMRAQQYKKASSTLNYERLADDVTHIVYRDTISATVADTRPSWAKVCDTIGSALGYQTPPTRGQRHIEVIVDASPTGSELTALVDRYSEEHDETSDWNNIGLKLGGRSESTTWLDEFVLTDELIIGQVGNEIYTAEQLLRAITAQRTRLVEKIGTTPTTTEENEETDEATTPTAAEA